MLAETVELGCGIATIKVMIIKMLIVLQLGNLRNLALVLVFVFPCEIFLLEVVIFIFIFVIEVGVHWIIGVKEKVAKSKGNVISAERPLFALRQGI